MPLLLVAGKELTHRDAVEKKLDYILRQLAHLEFVQRIPRTSIESAQFLNRTMDVFSATLNILAIFLKISILKHQLRFSNST